MENKAETKQWWRQSGTMYNFIMQCTAKAEKGKKAICVHGKLNDKNVYAEFHANSRDFSKGMMREVDLSIYSTQPQQNLEALIACGIKTFGGERVIIGATKLDCEVEKEEMRIDARRGFWGLPWIYNLKWDDYSSREGTEFSMIRFRNAGFLKEIAKSFCEERESGNKGYIYADRNGTDSQIIVYTNDSRNHRHNGVFMRKNKAWLLSDRLKEKDIDRFDEAANNTGYNYRGKEWNLEFQYEGKK